MKKYYLLLLLLYSLVAPVISQKNNVTPEDEAYTKTITKRAEKIVSALEISNPAKAMAAQNIIIHQYRSLNTIHTKNNLEIAAAKNQPGGDKVSVNNRVKQVEQIRTEELQALHKDYIAKLSGELTTEQVDKVKDGMTYGVLPLTYKGYQSMILSLTAEQKMQILTWLTEAREFAMDAESSEKKHQWFGKYKGRINNYLSAAGYDLKKEGEDWQKRIKNPESTSKN